MTRDLHELMTDALNQSTRALADTADDSARVLRLRGAVRRRRTTRAAVRSTSVACVAVVVGAVGWLVAPRLEPVPAHTPAPSVSTTAPAPTPSPTPTPTSAPTVAPETVVLPGLPPMPAATADLVARTTPGWLLFRYAGPVPDAEGDGPDEGAVDERPRFDALVLASPEGEQYHLVDIALDAEIHLDRWVAGSRVAEVTGIEAGAVWWGTIDLLTAEVTIQAPVAGETAGWTRAGERVVVIGDIHLGAQLTVTVVDSSGTARDIGAEAGVRDAWNVSVNPSGGHVLVEDRTSPGLAVIIDLETNQSRPVPGWPSPLCTVVSWIDDVDVLVRCQEGDERPAHWRIDTSAAGSEPLLVLDVPADASTDVFPSYDGVPSGDGGVAFTGTGPGVQEGRCESSAYIWRSASDTVDLLALSDDLSVPWPIAGRGGDVYIERMPVCADVPIPELSRINSSTGDTITLVRVDKAASDVGSARSSTVAVAPPSS